MGTVSWPKKRGNKENPAMPSKSFKVVTLGDGNVGKSCLLGYMKGGGPLSGYMSAEPFEWIIDGEECEVELVDQKGQAQMETLRKLSYQGASVALICFDLTNPVSLENVEETWIKELREGTQDDPCKAIILVGTKYDLYDELKGAGSGPRGEEPVAEADILNAAKQIGAKCVVLTSAK